MKEATLDTRTVDAASLGAPRDGAAGRRLSGILWREHLAHQRVAWGFLGAWIILQFVLPVMFHPVALLLFSTVAALALASSLGGADARDGVREFLLALPPTRSDLFRVRAAYGLALVGLMAAGSVLAVHFQVAQALWGLVVETGFTRPYATLDPVNTAAVILAPLAAFACTFGLASLASDRSGASAAWLGAVLLLGLVVTAGLVGEYYLLRAQSGWFAVLALGVVAVAALVLAHRAFRAREGVDHPARTSRAGARGRTSPAALFLVLALLFLLLAMIFWMLVSGVTVPEG